MGKYINTELLEQKQNESDKDMIIAQLTQELAETKLQLNDMVLVIADLQTKVGGTT